MVSLCIRLALGRTNVNVWSAQGPESFGTRDVTLFGSFDPPVKPRGCGYWVRSVLAETGGVDIISEKVNITSRIIEQGNVYDFQFRFLLDLHHDLHECNENRNLCKLISNVITKNQGFSVQLLQLYFSSYTAQQCLYFQKQTVRNEKCIGQDFILFQKFFPLYNDNNFMHYWFIKMLL